MSDKKDEPVNPKQDTDEAAEQAIKKSKETDSVQKGSDRKFNTWMRKAHENGNPEQLSPMQAEQNKRDEPSSNPKTDRLHDMSHEDTKWLVDQGLIS